MNWLENNQDIANVYIMDNVLRVGGKYHWQDAFECFFDKEEFESTWNHYQSFESPQSKAGTESKKEAEREANYEQGNVIYHDFGNGPH